MSCFGVCIRNTPTHFIENDRFREQIELIWRTLRLPVSYSAMKEPTFSASMYKSTTLDLKAGKIQTTHIIYMF